MTLEHLSHFPFAVEKVAFSLTPGWHPHVLNVSAFLTSSPASLMSPFGPGCFHFKAFLSPNYPSHAHCLHEEHPDSSVQTLGSFFNLFSFDSWWCSLASHRSSLLFCRRGSNSLLSCAGSFTLVFSHFFHFSSVSPGIDLCSSLSVSYSKDISLKLRGIFIKNMQSSIRYDVHDKGNRNNMEMSRFCKGSEFWLNRNCEYWCSLEGNGQTWSRVEEKLQLKRKKKDVWLEIQCTKEWKNTY